jgi:ATP-dependent RNA helicase DHX37/DHR1
VYPAILTFLSQTQAEIPSSLQLCSSATLWTGHAVTHQELLDRQEDKEVRRVLAGRGGKRGRNGLSLDYNGASEDDDLADDQPDAKGTSAPKEPDDVVESTHASASVTVPLPAVEVGSALKRNSDGTIVVPIARQRSAKKVCVDGTSGRQATHHMLGGL